MLIAALLVAAAVCFLLVQRCAWLAIVETVLPTS